MYKQRGAWVGTSRPNWAMAASRFSRVSPTARSPHQETTSP